MKNFNQNRSFNRGGFGGRDDRGRGPVTMHRATCAECGEVCEVPFRPTGDKPVYCSNCFGDKRGGERGGDRGPKRDFSRPSFSRPSFDRSREARGGGNEDLKRQLETIGQKLDRLTQTIERLIPVAPARSTDSLAMAVKKATPKKVASPKKKTAKKVKKN